MRFLDRHLLTQPHRLVAAAAIVSIALGLFFVFVRAPHPFGWLGIDHYHDLALTLANGGGFSTTDVPWGYALFVAAFYRAFGAHPWIPLVVQVLLNGTIPLMLFALVRREFGDVAAAWAAVLAGVFSFNTVYASTLAADSLCTVVFLASVLLFARGLTTGRLREFAASGLLAGIAPQMRPNLILFPIVLAGVALIVSAGMPRRRVGLVAYLALAATALAPWTFRNWRLTGDFMPTSSHGGIQLWYGTLQTGPYLKSRAHNPRSVFDASPFEYTSLSSRSLLITGAGPCMPPDTRTILKYWTDRDPTLRLVTPLPGGAAAEIDFTLPGQPLQTAVYYFLETTRGGVTGHAVTTPPAGGSDPFVFFVDDRHLTDLDRHDDLLDPFDVVRALRSTAWHEATGRMPDRDVREIVSLLLDPDERTWTSRTIVRTVAVAENELALELGDGSRFVVPRRWSGLLTDVSATGGLAAILCHAHRTWSSLQPASRAKVTLDDNCLVLDRVGVNDVFYRAEPHMMRRYTALATDNIRRDPAGFALASLYRFGRVFIVEGSSDPHTAQQFAGSGATYALATTGSIAYLALAIAGMVVARRKRLRVWLLVTPILYVPSTICFVLTNQRYSVTAQPFLFGFAAVAVAAAAHRVISRGPRIPRPDSTR